MPGCQPDSGDKADLPSCIIISGISRRGGQGLHRAAIREITVTVCPCDLLKVA